MTRFVKITGWICVVSVTALVVANLLALGVLTAMNWAKTGTGTFIPNNPWVERQKVYPGWEMADIQAMLIELNERPGFVYTPLAQFREGAMNGRFHTIHEAGFRDTGDGLPWPPDPESSTVFVFGGSTMFGWGVPDDETAPAYLSNILGKSVNVYNFGQPYAYSTHELLFFLKLAMEGYRPDLVVFVDGLNEFFHTDDLFFMTKALSDAWERHKIPPTEAIRSLVVRMPLYDLAKKAADRLFATNLETQNRESLDKIFNESERSEDVTEHIIRRYLDNVELARTLADFYGVESMFIWQPIPTYRYDLKNHIYADALGRHADAGQAYEKAKAMFAENGLASQPFFRWCADLQEGLAEPLYVDAVHYTARMNRLVAACVSERVDPSLFK
jgi:hypothetical protein